jgi:hypothetical protein
MNDGDDLNLITGNTMDQNVRRLRHVQLAHVPAPRLDALTWKLRQVVGALSYPSAGAT